MAHETTQIGSGVNPVTTFPATELRVDDDRKNKHQQKEHGSRQTKQSTADPTAIVKELNETMKMINTRVSFSVDKATKRTVVKVIDADTQKVIRQIPADEMLHIAAQINRLLGILVDDIG